MLKLLIVDDESIVREGLSNFIDWGKFGLSLIGSASNGKEALELFKNNPVDIVITDIRMPYMDGLELTREVKKISPSTFVILLSAFDDFSYAQTALRLGAFDYILKPVDMLILDSTITKAVESKNELSQQNDNIYVFDSDNVTNYLKQISYPIELEKNLLLYIEQHNFLLAKDSFDNIWNNFVIKFTLNSIKQWGNEFATTLLCYDPYQQISILDTKEEVYSLFIDLIQKNCRYINKLGESNTHLTKATLNLIHENYCDKNFSLNQVANGLYVTPNYLSTLFKNETNTGFSEYLTKYRVLKAKELLKNIRLKIYEVSNLVGYTDSHYFSKVFKNETGLTPKEYRKRFL